MCGIIGIVGKDSVNQTLYDGLTMLQHRGQDAAGIMTADGGRLYLRKNNGLVRDVFHTRHMLRLAGNIGIGHVRYPTAGSASNAESQPFYVNSPYGIAIAHNGNLTNAQELKKEVFRDDLRHINTESDSEVLLNVFAHELEAQGKLRVNENDIFKAITSVHRRCRGAYAVVAMIIGYGLVGFRDPYGIRPIAFGKRETDRGDEYIIASESVAIESLGFKVVRDIMPGEAIFIDVDGNLHSRQCADKTIYSPCIFEHVYFARPDSTVDEISVYRARMRMGEFLARKIEREWASHDIDVVIPIPDTSRTAGLQLANDLGLKFREGFIKNRYIGRTFIMPGQKERKKSVRQKLNPIDLEFRGRNVLLVDDSIVRGTTSKEIVQMARDAGANKVYFASASPPVRHANVYGIDMPSRRELVGFGRDEEQICAEIGADGLIYQDLDDLIESARKGNPKIKRFDTSVFNGDYVTGDITPEYLAHIENLRNDGAKEKQRGKDDDNIIDLYNTA